MLLAAQLGTRLPAKPDSVEHWRPLMVTHFPKADVEKALCVICHESGGLHTQVFEEWHFWWSQHPDMPRTDDWPRPLRSTALGRGSDSQFSVGRFQINVGNLAGNRIEGLARHMIRYRVRPEAWPGTSTASRSSRPTLCCCHRATTWLLQPGSGKCVGRICRSVRAVSSLG